MTKWRYNLQNGKALRDALEDNSGTPEEIIKVLDLIKKCYEEINEAFPDEYDRDDCADDCSYCDVQIDNINDSDDMTLDEVEEEVNYILHEFYDLCDSMKIFIPLDLE